LTTDRAMWLIGSSHKRDGPERCDDESNLGERPGDEIRRGTETESSTRDDTEKVSGGLQV